MTRGQFVELGCPQESCKELDMKQQEGRVMACTTGNFTGCIAIMNPKGWVARFNGLDGVRPGCYALAVEGKIPDFILHESEYEREDDEAAGREDAQQMSPLSSESESEKSKASGKSKRLKRKADSDDEASRKSQKTHEGAESATAEKTQVSKSDTKSGVGSVSEVSESEEEFARIEAQAKEAK